MDSGTYYPFLPTLLLDGTSLAILLLVQCLLNQPSEEVVELIFKGAARPFLPLLVAP
jgi:hypothetical protein